LKNEIDTLIPIAPFLGIHKSKLITFSLSFITGSIFYQFRNEISFNWLGIKRNCTILGEDFSNAKFNKTYWEK